MSWGLILLETGGKVAAGMVATLAFKWVDDRVALRARDVSLVLMAQ